MKKSHLLGLLLAAFAGSAFAQSSVVIYGNIDVGLSKTNDKTLAVAKRDANRLGFRGTEDLGNGLKALFQLEMRYEPDTGTLENGSRPLMQGQSRVGLQGDFGTVRVGRGLTAFLAAKDYYDPWNGLPNAAGFKSDVQVAGYNAEPLDPAGSSNDRINNGFWYDSPLHASGLSVSVSVGSKEGNGGAALVGKGTAAAPQYAANSGGSTNPFSLALSYKYANVSAMLGYDKNAIETRLTSAHLAVQATPDLKLVANYAKQNQENTKAANFLTKAWVVGANYTVGNGKFLIGYGQKNPEGVVKTRQTSVGYQYSLSKRTYTYVDLSEKDTGISVRYYTLGINHNF